MGWTNQLPQRVKACDNCNFKRYRGCVWLVTENGVFCSSECATEAVDKATDRTPLAEEGETVAVES